MAVGTATKPVWPERIDARSGAARRVLGERDRSRVTALAHHAACLALLESGRTKEAREHAATGLGVARRARLADHEAELRLAMARAELDAGNNTACLRLLADAEHHLDPSGRGQVACLRGWVQYRRDRIPEALVELTTAARLLRASRNPSWEATALIGRGLVRLRWDQHRRAEADLVAAHALHVAAGRTSRAALCTHYRGCVAAKRGDVPRALRLYSDAVEEGLDVDARPHTRVDRAEALAAAGMISEARWEMETAVARLRRFGNTAALGESQLALAECALRDGDLRSAIGTARRARGTFRRQRRRAWAALSNATLWRAKLRAGVRWPGAFRLARWTAAACARHGWPTACVELRCEVGRAADRRGRINTARAAWTLAAAHRDHRAATVRQRTLGWLAQAKLAEHRGQRDAVFQACRAGLGVLENHAATVVPFELRIQAFALAAELAEIAVRSALGSHDPATALRWVECHRAAALNARVVRPPGDRDLERALRDLRASVSRLKTTRNRPSKRLMTTIATQEERVRMRAWQVAGRARGTGTAVDLAQVHARLGDAVLVTFFECNRTLLAVSAVDGRMRLEPVAWMDVITGEVERLHRLLSARARARSERVLGELEHRIATCTAALDHGLLDFVRGDLSDDRPLIVIPTGRLHKLAWAGLPSCRARAVTVAPSLRSWLRAGDEARAAAGRSEQVWVAGPELDHAEREVRVLHEVLGGTLTTGSEATVDGVLAAIDGCDTAHLAAHGWFRGDQPLLSCVDLFDGPLYGYDLDRLRRAPRMVVLSACDGGRCAVRRGDELNGLAAALLARGAATVIASVVPVPDERTARVMFALHGALRRGVAPAAALASAQAEHGESGFVCLGHGGR